MKIFLTFNLSYMSIILDFIYFVAALFYLPALIFKGKHCLGLNQRFGIYSDEFIQEIKAKSPFIWLHAVSVGEIKALAVVVEQIRKNFPGLNILFSTVTPTGNEIAAAMAGQDDQVIYLPFDLSWIIRKALLLVKPKALLIMETELWPNLILEADRQNIPVVIVNGRISEKAFARYRCAAIFLRSVIKKIKLLCMQTVQDAEKIIYLGADKKNVHIVGNIKFDQINSADDSKIPCLGLKQEECLIVAGSTHNNEEEIIARVFQKLKKDWPNARLLIAPRHINRANDIERLLDKYGLSFCRINNLEIPQLNQGQPVFILGLMGVLNKFYRIADIVFVGGSLIPHGGQNPIEPAAFAKPVIFGRHMFNFSQVVKLFLDSDAAVCVNNEDELYESLKLLLKDPQKRKELAKRAQKIVRDNQGSAKRVVELLKKNILLGVSLAAK
ncbi:MAG: 3-deoxy-D-manno-octulosonic acid transferase [Candidatus Omnitrophica bacterium]|nr:3-deoxy-D-manno-octulosonic acid transferase [Candidatus Omnitrophota bacterium]